MKKKILWLLVMVLAVGAIASGCGPKAGKAGDVEDPTVTVAMPGADNAVWTNDDYYRYITEKVGIDIEF